MDTPILVCEEKCIPVLKSPPPPLLQSQGIVINFFHYWLILESTI